MTLVLSVSTPNYGLQVSDRMVSKGGRRHDPLANKSLVVRCSDGLLAIGYTGLAFIDGLATDEWLASKITQTADVKNGAIIHGAFAVGDTGSMLIRLAKELNSSAFGNYPGGLTAVGCQWKERNGRYILRSVLWQTVQTHARLAWRQTIPREMVERERIVKLQAIGTCPLPSERMQEISDLARRSGNEWQRVEDELVVAIRDASEMCPEIIGPHCCSTLLRKWHDPNVEIRFLPNSPHTLDHATGTVQVVYTPWIVSADSVIAPSLSIGGLTSVDGLLSYSIADLGAGRGQTLVGLLDRQVRPEK